MGVIAKVLSVERVERNGVTVTEIKANPTGGANTTMTMFPPSGKDPQPLKGDYAVGTSVPGKGRMGVVGFIDPVNVPVSEPGDNRSYSRDETTGTTVAQVWIKNDGSILISNDNGSVTITPDGVVEINGNTDFAVAFNDMQTAFDQLVTDVNAFVTKFNTHTHNGAVGAPPVSEQAAPSTADMSGAKVDTVKVP